MLKTAIPLDGELDLIVTRNTGGLLCEVKNVADGTRLGYFTITESGENYKLFYHFKR
jgi:hypothetical protein